MRDIKTRALLDVRIKQSHQILIGSGKKLNGWDGTEVRGNMTNNDNSLLWDRKLGVRYELEQWGAFCP